MSFLPRLRSFMARPHLAVIALIGVIGPRRARADWRQEWHAELLHRENRLAVWDEGGPDRHPREGRRGNRDLPTAVAVSQ